jgi:hypothetical protein
MSMFTRTTQARHALGRMPVDQGPRSATAGSVYRANFASFLDLVFPPDRPRPATWRTWALGLGGLIVGLWISLSRTGSGPGVFRTVWAEDGIFLTDAFNRPLHSTLTLPLQGYYVLVGRILALPTAFVPIKYAPALLSTESATVIVLSAMLVYVASRSHLDTPLARLIVAAPVVAPPIGENLGTTSANNAATLQFTMLYLMCWLLLWRPAARQWKVLTLVVAVLCALSTFLVVLLLPLALLRILRHRDWHSWGMIGSLGLSAVANITALSMGWTYRPTFLIPKYDPVWAIWHLFDFALPYATFGYVLPVLHQELAPSRRGMVAAGVVLVVVVGIALLRRFWWGRPKWAVAGVLLFQAAVLFCAAIMSTGRLEMRYVIAPELILFAAMLMLLRPVPADRLAADAAHAGAAHAAAARMESAGDQARSLGGLTGIDEPPAPVPGNQPGLIGRGWGAVRELVRPRRLLNATPALLLTVFVVAMGVTNYHLTSGRTVQTVPWQTLVDRATVICGSGPYSAVYVFPLAPESFLKEPLKSAMPKVSEAVPWGVRLPCEKLLRGSHAWGR